MATYKTKGIILKRTNLGEADRILTIYTDRYGKVKAIAKGVRKTLSKLAGHLEPFCLVNLSIAEGRNLDIVTDAEIVKCFIKLRNRLKTTNIAYYLAEIIDKMTAENEAHPEIFELLEEVLENLDNGQNKLLLAYFEMNFLAESGFKPELEKCLICGKKVTPSENYFSYYEGGLICGGCRNGDLEISDKAIKVLRLFLKHRISTIQKILVKSQSASGGNTDKKLAKEIENIASSYIDSIYQKEFKSKRFLKTG